MNSKKLTAKAAIFYVISNHTQPFVFLKKKKKGKTVLGQQGDFAFRRLQQVFLAEQLFGGEVLGWRPAGGREAITAERVEESWWRRTGEEEQVEENCLRRGSGGEEVEKEK